MEFRTGFGSRTVCEAGGPVGNARFRTGLIGCSVVFGIAFGDPGDCLQSPADSALRSNT